MSQPNPVPLRCNACGQSFPAPVRTVIDAQSDPQGKSLLLSDNLNKFRCPNCGNMNNVVSPLIYHDASKELFIAYVPMEVSLQSRQPEEKIVGDLVNEFTRSLPQGAFKAYMFNPKRALTPQGLIEQVLQADGISKEMLDQQKKRVELLQQLIEAPSNEALIKLIQTNDALIDLPFFQTMSMMAQRLMEGGQQATAARIVGLQEALLAFSSYGKQLEEQQAQQEQVIRQVAQDIQRMGEQASRADLIQLAVSYADAPNKLEALVGLVRPAFDEQLFNEFTQHIASAPATERDRLENVRNLLRELTQAVDQQQQAALQGVLQFLQAVVNSPEPEALLEENAELVTGELMSILNANLQEAHRRGDQRALDILNRIYNKCVEILQAQMSPELRFINGLLNAPDEASLRQAAQQGAGQFNPELLRQTCDAVEEILQEREAPAALQRLGIIRQVLGL